MELMKTLSTRLLVGAAVALLMLGEAAAGDGPVRVSVFAGQSNMVG